MKKVPYILSFLLGIILLCIGLYIASAFIFVMVKTVALELSQMNTPIIEVLKLLGLVLFFLVCFVIISFSPNLIEWSWKKIKGE